jgi:hypothetical protein
VSLRWLALVVLTLTTPGCAVLAAPPLMAAVSGGASGVARMGVDMTAGGAALRTFGAPLADVHAAVRQSFCDLALPISEDVVLEDGTVRLTAEARDREIRVRLEPVTPALTRLRLVVGQGLLGRDRATATALVEQASRALDGVRPAAVSASAGAR